MDGDGHLLVNVLDSFPCAHFAYEFADVMPMPPTNSASLLPWSVGERPLGEHNVVHRLSVILPQANQRLLVPDVAPVVQSYYL